MEFALIFVGTIALAGMVTGIVLVLVDGMPLNWWSRRKPVSDDVARIIKGFRDRDLTLASMQVSPGFMGSTSTFVVHPSMNGLGFLWDVDTGPLHFVEVAWLVSSEAIVRRLNRTDRLAVADLMDDMRTIIRERREAVVARDIIRLRNMARTYKA